MNKDKKIIPELRFPEFINDGEWDVKEFSSYIKLYRGSSPRPIQEYLTQSESGVNWIKIGDTKNAVNSIINKVVEKITPKGAEKSRKVTKGELVLANSMSFGKTYVLAIEGCIYDGWFVLREYEQYFDKSFLLQLLNSEYMQKQYQRLSAGGIVQNISSEIVYKTMLFHMSRQEQTKIASCLSSLDDLIAAQNQKLNALKAHKKGLMQNLFPQKGEQVPKYRFPEFVNDGEWKPKKFEELFEIGNGRDYKHLGKGNIPVYGSGGYMLSVDDYLYDGESACIGRKGTIDKPMFLNGKFWTVDTLFYTHSFKDCTPKFIYYIFQNINWINHNEAGGVPSLSKANIYKIETLVPEHDEQKRISLCLSNLDDLINIQTDKIDQLKEHKKGLMQGLFVTLK
jgi:type I restriction enzyme S subunit